VASDEFRRLRILEDALTQATAWRLKNERPRNLVAPADFDPRPVEFIWTLARYRGEPRVLDAGYANADPLWLAALSHAAPGEVVGVDLAHREVHGFESVTADLRDLPFADASFDVIFCISTIEHVGADNSIYGVNDVRDGGPLDALRELARVTAGDGRVLLTVPCGDVADDWYVRRPVSGWTAWFRDGGFALAESELYVERDGRWESGEGESGVLCVELQRSS
jgi:SAM-dependent methyltransferase